MGNRSSAQRRSGRSKQRDGGGDEIDRAETAPPSFQDQASRRSHPRWTSRSFAEGRSMEKYFADPSYHRGVREKHNSKLRRTLQRAGRRHHTEDDDNTNYYSNERRRALRQRRALAAQANAQGTASSTVLDGPPSSTDEANMGLDSLRHAHSAPSSSLTALQLSRLASPEAERSQLRLSAGEATPSVTTSPRPATASARQHLTPTSSIEQLPLARESSRTITGDSPRPSQGVDAVRARDGVLTTSGGGGSSAARSPRASPSADGDPLGGRHTSPRGSSTTELPGVPALAEGATGNNSSVSPVAVPRPSSASFLPDSHISEVSMPRTEAAPFDPSERTALELNVAAMTVPSIAQRYHRRSYPASDTSSRRSVRTVAHRNGGLAEPWVASTARVVHRDPSYVLTAGHRSSDTASLASSTRTRAHRRHTTQPRPASSEPPSVQYRPTRSAASVAAVERAMRAAEARRRGPPNNWSGTHHRGSARYGADGLSVVHVFGAYDDGGRDHDGGDAGGGFGDAGAAF